MASHSVGRAGVLVPPSLPTIRETTLSWLGSELENELKQLDFENDSSTTDTYGHGNNIKEFEDQCLSIKSGEESEFSGIQPLPMGSDDTSPMERNNFNRVVKMNFRGLVGAGENDDYSANRPKPFPLQEDSRVDVEETMQDGNNCSNADFNEIFQLLDEKMNENVAHTDNEEDSEMLLKLQIIRQWQLEQQQDLKRQQHIQLAMLKAKENELALSNENEINNQNRPNESGNKLNTNPNIGGPISNAKPEQISMPVKNGRLTTAFDDDNFDDKPLPKEDKKFEDLLEKEIKKDLEFSTKESSKAAPNASKQKHKFLRRGEGIARFNGPPIKKPPKKSKPHAGTNKPINKTSIVANAKKKQNFKPRSVAPKLIQKLVLKASPPSVKNDNMFKPIVNESEPKNLIPNLPATKSDDDLQEFELLEQYAEEDASFFSEPSLVVSVLKERQDIGIYGQKSLRERVRERREARGKDNNTHAIQVPTPIYPQILQKQEPEPESQVDEVQATLDEEQPQPKIMRRKVVSLIKKEKVGDCAINSNSFVRKMVISTPVRAGGSSSSEADVDQDEFDDDKTWEAVDYTMQMQNDFNLDTDDYNADQYKFTNYMDLENENAENPVKDTDGSRVTVINSSSRKLSLSPPPPPTYLMQKLFPGLKASKEKQTNPSSSASDSDAVSSRQSATESESQKSEKDQIASTAIKQKLSELEAEIEKFRTENKKLDVLTTEKEKSLQTLASEMQEFQRQKDEELNRLEEHKKTEMKKLKKEKKVFEDHVMKMKSLPTKAERDEIQKLKDELESMKCDLKTKEDRWSSATSRMRTQIQRLEEENEDLKEQLKEVERQRLNDLNSIQKSNKNKQHKNPSVWKAINEMVDSVSVPVEQTKVEVKKNNSKKPPRHSGKSAPLSHSQRNNTTTAYSQGLNPEPLPNKFSPQKHNEIENIENQAPGKVERVLGNGNKLVEFANGTQKEVLPDGKLVKINFANGDVKRILDDGTIVYFYKENGTTHTTQPDGLQILEFPNKQVEHHFNDGTKQISFPDGTVKYLHTDGTEQTLFQDGTEMHVASTGDKTIVFANGQREIHTATFKRREYPDGTSKTVFEDGRQETRYASGRLRVKDSHGNVIVDRMNAPT